MIEIYIDILTDKIIGYNDTIQPKPIYSKNRIVIDNFDDELFIKQHIYSGNLYFVDERPVLLNKKEKDTKTLELFDELSTIENLVDNEQKVFMDNIISGMDINEASKISRENRTRLKELKSMIDNQTNDDEERRRKKMTEMLVEEEKDIVYPYFLSMITIVRDENDYLEEWIRYHIEEMGFDHFYIYDNESQVSVETYLKSVNFKYLDKITIVEWETSEKSQEDSHNHFLETFRDETKWFMEMDPDEYIVLKNDGKTLVEFLNDHSEYSTIKCLWKHFNANGHVTKSNEPDMIRFTQDTTWDDYKHGGKYFALTHRIERFYSYVPIPYQYTPTLGHESKDVQEFFQLNHYYTRSYEEWVQKIKRGSSNPRFFRRYSDFFELNPDMKYLDTGENFAQTYGSAKSKEEVNN